MPAGSSFVYNMGSALMEPWKGQHKTMTGLVLSSAKLEQASLSLETFFWIYSQQSLMR